VTSANADGADGTDEADRAAGASGVASTGAASTEASDATDTDEEMAEPTAAVEIRTNLAEVARVRELTPKVRRITFAGEDLERYEWLAPDQFLYLLLPPPGRTELTIGRDFDWVSFYVMPEDERPVGSHYTVRYHRPEQGEIDIDVVLHTDPGPASGWAERAQPGDPVALWGPRTCYKPPDPVDWYLLLADETGLPATAAVVDHLARQAFAGPVMVIAEVADATEHQPIGAENLPGLSIEWLHRDGKAAGTTTALLDAVLALDLPPGEPYIWGGGESRIMTSIRKHVRRTDGYPRERVSLTGYWRHALHTDDPDDPDDPDDEEDA
jgi:NADPH-dependent ferric siderophore reductase